MYLAHTSLSKTIPR